MPHHEELCRNYAPEKLLKIGQELYRQDKYDEALEAFDAAEKASNGSTLTLLDNRAATYEKLGNLQAALVDARYMIKWQPTEVQVNKTGAQPGELFLPNQGYLRTSKILRKMDKADLALRIYERGLSYVSVKNSHFDLLRQMNEKLSMSLAPPKAVDFFAILPIELVEMIWSYVPFHTICQCLRVSKGWQNFLKSWPFLWSNLDFSKACGTVRSSAVRQYLDLSQGMTRQASLKGIDLQNSKTLAKLFRKSRLLEDLTILTGGYVGKSLLSALGHSTSLKSLMLDPKVVLPYETIMGIMIACPNLAFAEFGTVTMRGHTPGQRPGMLPNLQHLSLNLDAKQRPILSDILPPTPALTRLVVRRAPVISEVRLGDIRRFGQNLEELILKDVTSVDSETSQAQIPLPSSLRKLTMLRTGCFDRTTAYRNRFLRRIVPETGLPLLSELVLGEGSWDVASELVQELLRCSAVQPSQLVKFTLDDNVMAADQLRAILTEPRLQHVKYLGLEGSQYFTDDLAFMVADTMKDLLHMDLRSTKLTGCGVKRLVQALPQLKMLNLNDCILVNSDAVDWARSQGITVLFQFADRR